MSRRVLWTGSSRALCVGLCFCWFCRFCWICAAVVLMFVGSVLTLDVCWFSLMSVTFF